MLSQEVKKIVNVTLGHTLTLFLCHKAEDCEDEEAGKDGGA